jgi:hypothetical protein
VTRKAVKEISVSAECADPTVSMKRDSLLVNDDYNPRHELESAKEKKNRCRKSGIFTSEELDRCMRKRFNLWWRYLPPTVTSPYNDFCPFDGG